MDPKDTNIVKALKKIKTIDIVYLIVIFLFTTTTIVILLYSTNYIKENINKIFLQNEEVKSQVLDITNYLLVEKKLNLPVNIINDNPVLNVNNTETQITQNNIPTTENKETTKPVLDKKSITIIILNTTNKKGVASILAKALENDGFSKATTGNETKAYASTTILIKDSKKDYTSSIEKIVKKSYPKVVTETNPENSDFDVTIIISK